MNVIVIRGGPAGVTAALRARELGAQVTVVERGQPGGTCTNDSGAPTHALAHITRHAHDFRQFGEWRRHEHIDLPVTPSVTISRRPSSRIRNRMEIKWQHG